MNKKKCTKCGEEKNVSDFHKRKESLDGVRSWCKSCVGEYGKEYREKNRELNIKRCKKWRDDNKKWIKEYKKIEYKNKKDYYNKKNTKWKENNKEEIRTYRKKQSEGFLRFDTELRKHIEVYEDLRKSEDENVECRCAYCGDWFKPLYKQIRHRLSSINGSYSAGSEFRLYCSQNCKDNCPVFRQQLYPKNYKPTTSREVQPQLRKLVFERDNYTCQKCNKHKNKLEKGLHCHHKYPLNEDPIQSADVDSCITLCKDCHKWVHQNVAGCGYGEMRCNG